VRSDYNANSGVAGIVAFVVAGKYKHIYLNKIPLLV